MLGFLCALADLYLPDAREGQGLVEYALIIVLVALVAIAGLTAMGGQLNSVFSNIAASLANP